MGVWVAYGYEYFALILKWLVRVDEGHESELE